MLDCATSVTVYVNGTPRQLPPGCTIAELITQLHPAATRFAVERNGEIVSRSQHAHVKLQAGDRIEIVIAVGGG